MFLISEFIGEYDGVSTLCFKVKIEEALKVASRLAREMNAEIMITHITDTPNQNPRFEILVNPKGTCLVTENNASIKQKINPDKLIILVNEALK